MVNDETQASHLALQRRVESARSGLRRELDAIERKSEALLLSARRVAKIAVVVAIGMTGLLALALLRGLGRQVRAR